MTFFKEIDFAIERDAAVGELIAYRRTEERRALGVPPGGVRDAVLSRGAGAGRGHRGGAQRARAPPLTPDLRPEEITNARSSLGVDAITEEFNRVPVEIKVSGATLRVPGFDRPRRRPSGSVTTRRASPPRPRPPTPWRLSSARAPRTPWRAG